MFFFVAFFLIKNKIDSVAMQIILQSYVVGDNISDMLINSTNVTQGLYTWFSQNQMIVNSNKRSLI